MPDHPPTPFPPEVILRDVIPGDQTIFFQQQLDPQANHMAAFTAKNPADRAAFDAHWAKILGDRSITLKTILYQGQVAGNVVCHSWFGEPEIGYWIGRQYWGKGITTQALTLFLGIVTQRPRDGGQRIYL
jgi:RimJ/RimL family protein N-acetyltransferase